MTREEAIRLLDINKEYLKNTNNIGLKDDIEALDMAIKALEQEPCEEELDFVQEHKKIPVTLDLTPTEDVISRQAVLDQTYLWSKDEFLRVTNPFDYLRKRINSLPPVTPQPKTGHWITEDMFDGDVAYRCSECNELFWLESGTPKDNEYNFCPKCGAKMVEPQERSGKE